MTAAVRHYSDPACVLSWGGEPNLRRLIWEFGDQLEFTWVMGGLARRYDSGYRDEDGRIGLGPDRFADLVSHWLDVTAETGMPCDPRLWTQNPISSTYPVCQAVKAASEQGSEAGHRYLRRVREALLCQRRKLDHAAALIGEAGAAGLDADRFGIDLHSHAITELFAADLDEVRDVPGEARAQGQVRTTEGHERIAFPSVVFIAGDGSRRGVWGRQPYQAYRDAAVAAGATPVATSPADPVGLVERFGRMATRELCVLLDRPGPVVEAELWALARDWKLRPLPVLSGTLWERA